MRFVTIQYPSVTHFWCIGEHGQHLVMNSDTNGAASSSSSVLFFFPAEMIPLAGVVGPEGGFFWVWTKIIDYPTWARALVCGSSRLICGVG